ncbi:hypothetical protein QL995_14065 [Pseudoalteromonas sp. APC 3358]|uniref:hypothetical protein n=1 Tax=unclassified Pseudoalteromonas TaxID=194690 RepID=UPI0018CFBA7B|nr:MULTISPECIES: hypothetical protein [unclassified Pseudoalteromonas]MBH0017106.1 hypothetical protein [Pseudoalteromonas sp. NGC95]MDN3383784.1 hypothetical protein [Pseudoalteromonas sp. APC 3358]
MTIKYKSLFVLLAPSLLLLSGYAAAHSQPLNQIAVKACFEKQKSQSCQYQGGHNDLYIGSCQYMADDLMCVRNQPIQKVDNKESKTNNSNDSHEHQNKQHK